MEDPSNKRKRHRNRPPKKSAPNVTSFPPSKPKPEPSFTGMATPPLTVPIPQDTMRFADLAKENLLHPVLIQTITEDLKFDHMMPVQEATLYKLLHDRIDCLAQAKTGTGKTIAFLLPAIQTLINKNKQLGRGISLLVISPTRELALQIAKEANALLQRLPQYRVATAIGGTNKNTEGQYILSGCDILVGTPGRLIDHMSDDRFKGLFGTLDTLVLDEADRLLDMGFMPQLKEIIAYLPDKQATRRQGMLFSATIAPHVEKVAHLVLSPGYSFISTIPEGEANTHERVPQFLITVPEFSDLAPALIGSIKAECAHTGPDIFKAIVFAPTAAQADWYGQILGRIGGFPLVNMLHSRLTQSKRTGVTNAYRDAKNGILVATDVVARGMDFPNVTSVFQVGIPADKASYIHRLGRTARAGREGRAIFIVTQHESFFPRYTLKDITFQPANADLSFASMVNWANIDLDTKGKVYQAWLGYYKSHLRPMGWDTSRLVAEANKFARDGLGCPEVPGLQKSTVGKMGLKGVPGLKVVPNAPQVPNARGGGEGRSRGAGGRGNARGGKKRGG